MPRLCRTSGSLHIDLYTCSSCLGGQPLSTDASTLRMLHTQQLQYRGRSPPNPRRSPPILISLFSSQTSPPEAGYSYPESPSQRERLSDARFPQRNDSLQSRLHALVRERERATRVEHEDVEREEVVDDRDLELHGEEARILARRASFLSRGLRARGRALLPVLRVDGREPGELDE
ncbi:hypothetical protein BD413DRAFT_29423 [Trametes elegans]|nr:hypothetical protein BD413DRAFT_29423 [Trametes elegans]